MIEKTLSEHIVMVILHFGAKMWFLNKNHFIAQKYRCFTRSRVMGSGNILWKFEFDQIIFLDFTGIESLKYTEIRVSGAKLFWGVYKLQICQNKCVRFILDLPPRHSVNCDILKFLNMLNIEHRAKQMRLNHVFNIVHDNAPLYMKK